MELDKRRKQRVVLSDHEKMEMLRDRAEGNITVNKLIKKYGVSMSTYYTFLKNNRNTSNLYTSRSISEPSAKLREENLKLKSLILDLLLNKNVGSLDI